MKAAVDVHYEDERAVAACVVFNDWSDSEPAALVREVLLAAAGYRPGRFFERELPCLLAVLETAAIRFDTILIDGYVHLRAGECKGLGARLYEALPYRAVVIGVAKSPLAIADRFVPIHRGRSAKPLYVSAIGCQAAAAARLVAAMHGPHRIPTLLRLADHHARFG
ncbi:MAG TPA: endonuclease V [Thermoanaerobaculales bacterium]|nr:endonuclease V [Thermoanaerobaculales bacterium]HPA82115.1 endonuclease V [Thermoanaerobaculales bacterium]HQL30549.1 endonuclease V [Thermoanaerobaculales bacterium]HQP44654.1 endonuclease V [Thermoanaerobaculales bacterium]